MIVGSNKIHWKIYVSRITVVNWRTFYQVKISKNQSNSKIIIYGFVVCINVSLDQGDKKQDVSLNECLKATGYAPLVSHIRLVFHELLNLLNQNFLCSWYRSIDNITPNATGWAKLKNTVFCLFFCLNKQWKLVHFSTFVEHIIYSYKLWTKNHLAFPAVKEKKRKIGWKLWKNIGSNKTVAMRYSTQHIK